LRHPRRASPLGGGEPVEAAVVGTIRAELEVVEREPRGRLAVGVASAAETFEPRPFGARVHTTIRSTGECPMRRLAAAFALLLALPAAARAAPDLLALDASWNELRLKSDVEALDRLLAEDWLLTHSDGRVQDKAEYLGELRTRSRTNQEIVNEDVRLRDYGQTAVVTGVSVQSGVSSGRRWQGRFRFTRVWIERDGRWVMVASHSSRVAE
jgi:ketosteroid isomerase-like protein